jgi:hypothetical protein
MGQWRHSCATDRGTKRLQLAQRIYSLARKENEVAQLIGAFSALAATNFGLGDLRPLTNTPVAALSSGVREAYNP